MNARLIRRSIRPHHGAISSDHRPPISPRAALILAGCIATLLGGIDAEGADGSWNVSGSGLWSATGSWAGGVIPGATTGTTNTDLATFSLTLGAASIVTVDTGRNVGGITFANGSAFGYTIGAATSVNTLLLSSGGAIQTASSNGNHTDAINAPVVIQGIGGNATFTNGTTSATSLLTIGNISGSSISGVSTAGNTTTLTLNGSNTATGNIVGIVSNGSAGGKMAVVKDGAGTWSMGFASNASTFTGGVTILAGTLRGVTGTAGQSFGAGNAINFMNTAGATLDLTTAVQTVGSLAGGGTAGGNVTLNSAFPFALGLDNTSTSYGGAITGTGGVVTKIGTGTQTFTGTNTYTGITRINGGTLALDFTGSGSPASNIIAATSPLNLAGGALGLVGKAGATNSQTFGGTTLIAGTTSAVNLTAGAGNPLMVNLGAIARNVGTTLDLILPAGIQSATNGIRTSTATTSNNVFTGGSGAYATVGGTDWAGLSNGNLVSFITAGGSYSTGVENYLPTNNVDVTDGDSIFGVTVNTLRLNGNQTLTLAGANTVSTGGILVTSAATTGATIAGGVLRSNNVANALQLINNGTQLTVSSSIADNGATPTILTLAGPGTTILSGANTYTGATYITGGTVKVGNALAIGSGAAINIADKAGAVLDLNGFDLTIASLSGGGGQGTNGQATFGTTGGTVALGGNILTVGSAADSTFGGTITGVGGSLVKVGAGALVLNSGGTFTGGVTIKAGTLASAGSIGNNALGTGTITLGDSAGGNATAILRVGGGLAIVGTYTYSNPIVLAPNTTGILDVNSASFSGSTTLTGGVTGPNNFRINTTPTGGGTITFSTNPINNSGTLTIGGTLTNTNVTIAGGIGPNVTDVFLSKANTGPTNGTTLATTLVNNSGSITNNGVTPAPTSISAPIGVNVTGIIQNSASSALTLSGTNLFRGPITVSAGSLTLSTTQAAGIASALSIANVASASVTISTTSLNLGSLAGGGTLGGGLSLTSTTVLTVGSDHTSTSYAGVISGSSATTALRKIGTGTLMLSGANTYGGGTTVLNGNLVFDYASSDPQGANALTLSGGQLTFKGNPGGTTTDTVSALTLVSNSREGITVQNNAAITTGAWTSGGQANPVLVNLASGTTSKLTTSIAFPVIDDGSASAINLNGIVMLGTNTALSKRANVYVQDASGIGFATQNASKEIVRYTGATVLTPGVDEATATTNSTNYKLSADLARTAALKFQTLEISTAGGPVTLSMGANALTADGSGRSILVTGNSDATITSTTGVITGSNLLQLANYGTGTTTLAMNLVSNALVKNGPGLVIYSGSTMTGDTHVTEGTLRFTGTNLDYSTSNVLRIFGGGIFEIGADLNGATAGDFSKPSANSTNGVALLGDGGFSAFGADRTVNLGSGAILTWGSNSFLSDPASGSTDNDSIFKLGSATSTHTLTFVNPIALGVRQRYVEVADGTNSTNVDGKLSGVLSGTGGLTKTGAGALEVSAANTYTGPTVVTAGLLEVSGTLNASASVSLSSATLLLIGSGDKVGNTTPVSLNNGTLKFADGSSGGFTETMGALSLSAPSTIDFGSGTLAGNSFNFSNLTAATIAALNSGTLTLNIWNWSGGGYSPTATLDPGTDLGQDRLLFSTLSGLTQAGLNQIAFYAGSGSGLIGTGGLVSFGAGAEIVPVPEPASAPLLGTVALLGLISFRQRRRTAKAKGRA